MKDTNNKPIRILSKDGSDIYRAMHRVDGNNGIVARDEKGRLLTKYFDGFLDLSLDTDRMKKVYNEHKELSGGFLVGKEYTTAIVNVSFDFSVKEFYNKSKYIYVRDGYDIKWDMLKDHVVLEEKDGVSRLIAIEVLNDGKEAGERYCAVEKPLDESLLESYFRYDEQRKAYLVNRKRKKGGAVSAETVIPTKLTKREVRSWLYENGFDVDGVHYVRYKRSAGSSREGHCLFIAEPLYADMMEWSSCGLDGESVADRASWQAYISLTLSSIEKKIHIPRQSILLLEDQYSCFADTVVRVSEDGDGLNAERAEVQIKNAVWDGEALLDRSVFEENGYADKGMMVLRNRFFKTCAFNTNLQEWFADNGITKPSQLGGYCSAKTRSIKDIKLVITESSLKYLKFKPEGVAMDEWLERWLDNIYVDKESSLFGVVKTDKATGPMGNRMVRTNYQLLNTLPLSVEDTDRLLSDSFDFLHALQHDPMYVRYYMNLFVTDEVDEEDFSTTDNYRHKLIADFSRRSEAFEGTAFYRDYRSELCASFKKRLKSCKVLVDGGYHTMLGNGIELLHAVIDKSYRVDEPLALADGEIYAPRFADGEDLLCQRSPHITMGNLFCARNKRVPEIDKYFNLGSAGSIVCVNAVRSNLQQRLNGCDYDSDTVLITNNPVLRASARKSYDKFLVPYCDVLPGGSISYSSSAEDLAMLDVKISENRIGEIVNLSQFLNCLFWDRLSRGALDGLEELYADICKLAVLSGMEIDKAKRLYAVSADAVLSELRAYKDDYKREHDGKIPAFFSFITAGKTKKAKKELADAGARLNTAISYVYHAVKGDAGRCEHTRAVSYTDMFELCFEKGDPTGVYSKRREAFLNCVHEAQGKIRHINYISKNKNRSERELDRAKAESLFEECKDGLARMVDDHLYYILLRELDRLEDEKARERQTASSDKPDGTRAQRLKRVAESKALLFAVLCYANDCYLMKRLKRADCEMLDLIPAYDMPASETDAEDTVTVYGYPHIMGRRLK